MDFVILKVNGQDVSNSSHEDAVRCFQSAEEPIIVEVLRRQPGRNAMQIDDNVVMTKNDNDNRLEDTLRRSGNGETESTSVNFTNEDSTWKRNSYRSNTNAFPFVSTGVQTDWAGLTDEDQLLPVSLNPEERTNDSFDDFIAHDIDFEEVTLKKTGSAEKLGLTVCYSSGSGSEDADTEVYISEIIPESLAARDGRLREGDQILRVNGKDVANKEQTENLFAETKNAVTILVSRCLYQDDEYDDRRIYIQDSPPNSPDNIPAYQNSMIEQLIIRQQQQQQHDDSKEEDQDHQQRQQPPPDLNHKDSDTNTSTLRASAGAAPAAPPVPCHTAQQLMTNPEIAKNSSASTWSQNSQKSCKSAIVPIQNQIDDRKQWLQDALKECTKSVESMGLRCDVTSGHHLTTTMTNNAVKLVDAYSSHVWSDTEHIYETIPESDNEPIYSSPYEHHRQWLQINSGQQMRKQCDHVQQHQQHHQQQQQQQQQQQPAKPWLSSSKSNSSGEEKDSSSAYNTGESCHSNPLTLELHQVEKDHHKSTLVLCPPDLPSTTMQKIGCSCPMSSNPFVKQPSKNQSTSKKSSSSSIVHHQHRERDNCTLNPNANPTNLAADTMYTNVANLQQTMMLQQRLFKQALNRKNLITRETTGTRKSKSHGNFQAPNLTQYQFVGSQQVCATTSTGTTTTMTTTTTTSWNTTPEDKDAVQMEWKVKRRPDGTRYIARRPVRSRVLRNRAIKISEERAGHTTEDDTMSEMKVGRYWTKDERKRQLERARERKQRQQELILVQQQQQIRLQSSNNENPITEHADDKIAKKPTNVVEQSHKKIAKKKAMLDDFATVQEMLLHGNRVSGTGGSGSGGGSVPVASGKLMGLLSVTTV